MNEGIISVRYARALFQSAKEKSVIDTVKKDMDYILGLSSIPDVRDMLESPVIKNKVKKSALSALLREKVSSLSLNLVLLCVGNNREMYLPSIARSYIEAANRHNGITRAKLTTAVPPGEELRARIRELIEKSFSTSVDMEELVDPDLTGGFMLLVEDKFIDGSVKSKLRKIKKELKKEIK